MSIKSRRLLCIVMDGIGERKDTFGNAVCFAHTPNLHRLKTKGLFTTLKAHGKAVGLHSDQDMGNSEVGHNALGAGRAFDQGAKLVQQAFDTGAVFKTSVWNDLVQGCKKNGTTLHLMGLLSDGNVHSHEKHLYMLMDRAAHEGVKKIRIHVLFDGRDVGEKSAEIYVQRLLEQIDRLQKNGIDVLVASGGGRMLVTMDRYNADWSMVERGWSAHVLGEASERFRSVTDALGAFRKIPNLTDQFLPAFVIDDEHGKPVGIIQDGDSVVFFNFRGDRALEITQAFEEEEFTHFARKRFPKVQFAGMMQYDGDLMRPKKFLVEPPLIEGTMGEHLVKLGLRQFACSETQKFGHVTYFWNGNRSGYIDKKLEEYVEITSDLCVFNERPWMKALEITNVTCERMLKGTFDFGRINFANGDMVGHTGDFAATVSAVSIVDLMIGKLIEAAKLSGTILVVTADHGNADDMFMSPAKEFPNWPDYSDERVIVPKTSHSLSAVPFYVFDSLKEFVPQKYQLANDGTLGNVASTCMKLMGLTPPPDFMAGLLLSP